MPGPNCPEICMLSVNCVDLMSNYVCFLTSTIKGLVCIELSLSVAGQYQKCSFPFLSKNVIPKNLGFSSTSWPLVCECKFFMYL
jgi:hypothetical protein